MRLYIDVVALRECLHWGGAASTEDPHVLEALSAAGWSPTDLDDDNGGL